MDCDGRDTHFFAGAIDAQSNFATIGNEDFLKHQAMTSRVWPNSIGCASCTQISAILPERGAEMGFIVFIASTMKSVSPSLTVSPTLTNGGFPGSGAT